ncbi:MopE-related protein [Nanoarchaeota archaeon]
MKRKLILMLAVFLLVLIPSSFALNREGKDCISDSVCTDLHETQGGGVSCAPEGSDTYPDGMCIDDKCRCPEYETTTISSCDNALDCRNLQCTYDGVPYVLKSDGICSAQTCECPILGYTTFGSVTIKDTVINGYIVSSNVCLNSDSCMPTDPNSNINYECCGDGPMYCTGNLIGSSWCNDGSWERSYVCYKPPNFFPRFEHRTQGSLCTGSWSQWSLGQCPFLSSCCEERQLTATCVDPDSHPNACEETTNVWVTDTAKYEPLGIPKCAGDDDNETYITGPDGTFAVCDDRNTTNGLLGGTECVYGGVCRDTKYDVSLENNICDGIDNDCDGTIDESASPYTCACAGTVVGGPSGPFYGVEVWDGWDNNCNNEIDLDADPPPGTECTFGQMTLCERQVGVCKGSVALCDYGFNVTDCNAAHYGINYENNSDGAVPYDTTLNTVNETKCDGLDNDCDGFVDEGCNQISLIFFKNSSDPDDARFRSCLLYGNDFNDIDAQFDPPTVPPPNIINVDNVCTNMGRWFCDFNSQWKDAMIYAERDNTNVRVDALKNITYLSNDSDFPAVSDSYVSCCPNTYCFNGTLNGCEAPYIDPQKAPIGKDYGEPGYRCDFGTWAWNVLKYDWTRAEKGYCLENTDCFGIDDNDVAACFDAGSWLYAAGRDHYCENGNWTSRTKFIAAQLLDYASDTKPEDFSLYCDEYSKTLNEYSEEYENIGEAPVGVIDEESYLEGYAADPIEGEAIDVGCPDRKCVNNFCVLKIAETKVIAGTSLNRPIDETPLNFLKLFNKSSDYCDAVNSTEFIECGENKIYYLQDKQIALFSTAPFSINQSGFQKVTYFIKHPIESTLNFIRDVFRAPFDNTTKLAINYTETIADFDRLYVAVKDNKVVRGVVEIKYDPNESIKEFMAINYTGFTADICDVVSTEPTIICESNGTQTYIFTEDKSKIDEYWDDLTGKIRLK